MVSMDELLEYYSALYHRILSRCFCPTSLLPAAAEICVLPLLPFPALICCSLLHILTWRFAAAVLSRSPSLVAQTRLVVEEALYGIPPQRGVRWHLSDYEFRLIGLTEELFARQTLDCIVVE